MSNCTTGCRTQDHRSYAECLKSKAIKVGYDPTKGFSATKERKWNADLDHARSAMAAGILPDNCTREAVDDALRQSESSGMAYRSDTRPDLDKVAKDHGLDLSASKGTR